MIFDFRLLIFDMGSHPIARSEEKRGISEFAEGSVRIGLRIPDGRMF